MAKEKTIYRAKHNAPFSSKRAQIYGECVEEILDKRDATVRPIDVVNAASVEYSPLHDYFDWNDKSAGAKYRVYQARQLINHLVTVTVTTDGEEREDRAFLNVTVTTEGDKSEHIYVPIERALTNEEFRRQILIKAIKEIEYWKQKYNDYGELSEIFKEIERVKEAFDAHQVDGNIVKSRKVKCS